MAAAVSLHSFSGKPGCALIMMESKDGAPMPGKITSSQMIPVVRAQSDPLSPSFIKEQLLIRRVLGGRLA